MSVANEKHTHSETSLYDSGFLLELRGKMLKFATLQLGDEQLAEDAVQEALAGALKNRKTFARQAALSTWMYAILKNKIADILRSRHRFTEASEVSREYLDEDDSAHLFDSRDHWANTSHPAYWSMPAEEVKNAQFWKIFEICLEGMSVKHARFFMMREFLELETTEICEATGVSVSNLNVILYRARMRLRECLELNWFKGDETR
ncbi:ECF RNA polymerase sigma factor SigG [Thalassocella blandensis]|nr:ECF RNA polymerase sigma factor SigG [Thalassocella blandensis]